MMGKEIDYDKDWRGLRESLGQLQGLADAAAERARRRDMFAAAALTGLRATPGGQLCDCGLLTREAWAWADSMLFTGDATAGRTSANVPPSPATRPGEAE